MRLGPLRETCIQPAPKSRFVVFGRFVSKEHKQIKCRCFPAEAGPTKLLWDRLQPGMDAERPGMHAHAERGYDHAGFFHLLSLLLLIFYPDSSNTANRDLGAG
jgi:hypothetical protein